MWKASGDTAKSQAEIGTVTPRRATSQWELEAITSPKPRESMGLSREVGGPDQRLVGHCKAQRQETGLESSAKVDQGQWQQNNHELAAGVGTQAEAANSEIPTNTEPRSWQKPDP